MCVHGDDFMVASRIDVVQDAKAMAEHKVDIEVLAIIGPGQHIQAKIVKRVLSWRPDGFTGARLEQSRAAMLTPGTAVRRTELEMCKSNIIGWRHYSLARTQ